LHNSPGRRWHGTLGAFDSLDRNDDGLLSRAEVGGN